MITLGINISHNSSACIMSDGVVKIAIQEERIIRKKNFTGYPKKSIDLCLSYLKENNTKADLAVLTTKFLPAFSYRIPINHFFSISDYKDFYGDKFYKKIFSNQSVKKYVGEIIKRREKEDKIDLYINYKDLKFKHLFQNSNHLNLNYLKKQTKGFVKNYKILDHHSCHAYYAFYGLRNNEKVKNAIITMDSWGDGRNQTFWIKEKNKPMKLISSSPECQLGRIYKFTTLVLSMKPDEHEYKVMGMAPYAKDSYAHEVYEKVYKNILTVKNCKVVHKNKPKNLYQYLETNLKNYRFDNIAGAVQILVEKILIELFKQIHKKYKIRNFSFSGGVAMNVKANKVLSELKFVDSLNVPPSGGDESLCIGGCYLVENLKKHPIKNIYLGNSIHQTTNEKIQKTFSNKKFIIKKNINHKYIANLLHSNEIIAVARDREEFGARALGNRSIIANPSNNQIIKKINEQIKNRDFWMPFALTILKDHHKKYLINPKNINSEFMTVAMNTQVKNYSKISAGSHQYDKTIRPQILSKEYNPNFYNIIKEFMKKSKIPAVLNTSLNLHGLPIASNINDIFEVFDKSSLKYLYLNDNYLIKKND